MPDQHVRARPFANLLLAAFLVAAQWGALAHAFEHKAGTPQKQVCATCIAASQLGFACIDTQLNAEPLPSYPVLNTDSTEETKSRHTLTARQRGPPSSS